MVNRRREGNYGILMLGAQLLNYGLENIPPATLALIAGQTAIFLDFFPKYFPSPNDVCVSSYLVFHRGDWRRLVLSTFTHGSDMHLYFNMLSLLYKGSFLERYYGTPYFIYLVSVFSALTSATYVGIGLLLGHWLHESYLASCAVGFSGVLFALKVLTTQYSPPGVQYAFGVIPVPNKYMFWAELILIQLMVPNASFVGHLAGILVGLLYTTGPIKYLMNLFIPPGIPSASTANFMGFISPPREGNTIFGPSGSSADQPQRHPRPGQRPGQYRAQQTDYSRYTGGMSTDQQLQRALEESLREQRQRQDSFSRGTYPGTYPGTRTSQPRTQYGSRYTGTYQPTYGGSSTTRRRYD